MQRTLSEALVNSKTKAAYRVKDDGLLFFYQLADDAKSGQYWTQCANGTVRKFTFSGQRQEKHNDWKPLMEGSNEYTILVEKNGEPPGEGSAGWTKAIGASPVNVAMRRDKDGRLMVRRSKDRTWIYSPATNDMIRLRQGFRHYSGWEPMPEDHPLARSPWNEERLPYRDPAFAPEMLKDHAEQLEEWVRTGSCALLKAHKAKADEEIRLHNESLRDRNEWTHVTIREARKDGGVSTHTLPLRKTLNEGIPNKDALVELARDCVDTVIDEPSPHVLENIGTMTEALASTTRSMIDIGQNELATELATALKHLVSNASWLLRNDRTERLRQKVNGGS